MDGARSDSGAAMAQVPAADGSADDDSGWLDAAATLQTVARKSGTENFPVASRLLPARHRADLLAVYGFARLVDDVGDEFPGDRLALLDAIDEDVDRLRTPAGPRSGVLRTLVPTVRAHDLPLEPFHRLVEANRRDQTVTGYETYPQLLDYCTYSADPVGRLVLGVFDAADPDRIARSDAVCTALQLVEHWQDVAEDAARGRIYLPAEDMRRFGVSADDLTGEHAQRPLRRLLAYQVSRAQTLLDRGAPLVGMLSGPARVAVAGFVAGGQTALDALGAADFDVLPGPPRARKARTARVALRLMRGRP